LKVAGRQHGFCVASQAEVVLNANDGRAGILVRRAKAAARGCGEA
jgi:hypothetical protein